jgi:hypothetical protein
MGKNAKEHRKRVAKRNEQIKQQKRKMEKAQQEFLMKLIEAEKQKGSFNSPVMPMPGFEGPNLGMPIDNSTFNPTVGPQI